MLLKDMEQQQHVLSQPQRQQLPATAARMLTYPPKLGRQSTESINDSITLGALCYGVFRQGEGHHGDDHHLGSVGLSGGHPNLTACVDVDSAVCVARNGTAHCVGDTNAQSTSLLGIVQSLNDVCLLKTRSLTGSAIPTVQCSVCRAVSAKSGVPIVQHRVHDTLCAIQTVQYAMTLLGLRQSIGMFCHCVLSHISALNQASLVPHNHNL